MDTKLKVQVMVRESLIIRGYTGIGGKINLFEKRKSSQWRNSRPESFERIGLLRTDNKVKDLVSRFESKPPDSKPVTPRKIDTLRHARSPIPVKRLSIRERRKSFKSSGDVSEAENKKELQKDNFKNTPRIASTDQAIPNDPVYGSGRGSVEIALKKVPVLRLYSKEENSFNLTNNNNFPDICKTTVKITSGITPEREAKLTYNSGACRYKNSETSQNQNAFDKSNNAAKRVFEYDEIIIKIVEEVFEILTDKPAPKHDLKKQLSVPSPAKSIQDEQLKIRDTEVQKEQMNLPGEQPKRINNNQRYSNNLFNCEEILEKDWVFITLAEDGKVVNDIKNESNVCEIMTYKSNLDSEDGVRSDRIRRSELEDNAEGSETRRQSNISYNEYNQSNRPNNLLSDFFESCFPGATNDEEEYGANSRLNTLSIDNLSNRSVEMSLENTHEGTEPKADSDVMAIDVEDNSYNEIQERSSGILDSTDESQLIYKRNTNDGWRRRAVKSKRSESLGIRITAKQFIQEQELYQDYSVLENESLRKLMIKFQNDPEQLGYYLLHRNGSKADIDRVRSMKRPRLQLDLITGPGIFLWRSLPAVTNSGVVEQLTKKQLACQEAIFEIISSQASYVKSLEVLQNHFIEHISEYIKDQNEIKKLFAHIEPLFWKEPELLSKMVQSFNHDYMMKSLPDLIKSYYTENKTNYLRYGRSQDIVQKEIEDRMAGDSKFKNLLTKLSADKKCGFLPFESYLILPMQRVTKLPLLLKSVIAYLEENSEQLNEYSRALVVTEEVAEKMNNEIGKMRRWEEMLKLDKELDFGKTDLRFSFFSHFRYLILRSSARRVKNKKTKVELLLFNDILIIVKKIPGRSYRNLRVCDYCYRTTLEIDKLTEETISIHFDFLSERDGDMKKEVFVFNDIDDKIKWVHAISPDPLMYAYVAIKKEFKTNKPTDLTLDTGDIVGVVRADSENGMGYGCKLSDGSRGNFPLADSFFLTDPEKKCRLKKKTTNDTIFYHHLNEVTDDAYAA